MSEIIKPNERGYIALFLEQSSFNVLTSFLKSNFKDQFKGKVYLDHITLLHWTRYDKRSDLYRNLTSKLGTKLQVRVTKIGWSDKAFAFGVDSIEDICDNRIPHLTISTYNDGKPYDSNNIKNWVSIDPIYIKVMLNKYTYCVSYQFNGSCRV